MPEAPLKIPGTIELPAIKVHAAHGVMPQERLVGNDFSVGLTICYDITRAALSDDIARAINYAEVVEAVREVMARPCCLLERVAWNLCTALADRFPLIEELHVKVTKPSPPIPGTSGPVSVATSWRRHRL